MTPTINSEDTVLAAAELRVRSLVEGLKDLRSYLNLEAKKTRLLEIEKELESPQAWSERERMTELTREKNSLTGWIQQEAQLAQGVGDCSELIEILSTEEDSELIAELQEKLADCEAAITDLEVRQLFSGEADSLDCFLNIQSGSGGTEAQDWADMLLRMYLRWVEKRGFDADVQDKTLGEVAGIKSASIAISGDCAYGLLRTETGVHRLVRKSPFDSGSRRHTSFASVFVTPQLDETIEVEIDWSDVRVDTYRASGAGGQHINKTDSAVRMTHLPTKLVVQCQSERSQHQNREKCVKQLEAGLYELELRRRNAEKQKLEDSKTDIGWGQQIRSYVLDQSRIKDLRTGTEVTNTVAVLDGDLDPFILASLKQGL